MDEEQRFIKMVESIEIPNNYYSLKVDEFIILFKNFSQIDSIIYAFNYGFKRGTNYGRKQEKSRKTRARTKKQTDYHKE